VNKGLDAFPKKRFPFRNLRVQKPTKEGLVSQMMPERSALDDSYVQNYY
jgi:hypothetical protein